VREDHATRNVYLYKKKTKRKSDVD
jgi:hypothetical protein